MTPFSDTAASGGEVRPGSEPHRLDNESGNIKLGTSLIRQGTASTPRNIASVTNSAVGIRHQLSRWLLVLFTKLVPQALWYPAVLQLVGVQAHIQGAPGTFRLQEIEQWMRRLTWFGRDFPIPWKAVGLEALPPRGPIENGVLFCSAHIPMVRIGLRALIELGHCPTATLAAQDTFAAGTEMLPIWGLTEQVPAIASGRHALVRVRSILKKGGSVSLLTDMVPGGGHSENAFHLSRRLGSRMIFFFTEVQPDGSILVSFKKPPCSICTTAESIEINIRWLEEEVRRITASTG